MKKIIFTPVIVILIVLISCKSSHKSNYKILVSQPTVADGEIHGYALKSFFDNKKNVKKAKIKDFELFSKEIYMIKDSLNKSSVLPNSGERFGVYKYAFIIAKDTLYSTSTFEGWRYENKVFKYEQFSPLLKEQILQSFRNLNY